MALSVFEEEGLPTRRPLELDDVAFGVRDIQGRAFALRAVALLHRSGGMAVRCQLAPDRRLVERVDPEAEVIQVAALRSRRRTACTPEHAVDRHEIDQRAAGAQLDQADRILATLDPATEGVDVEAKHRVQVDHAQDKMVDFPDVDHGACVLGG